MGTLSRIGWALKLYFLVLITSGVVTCFHEAGHYVATRANGLRVTKVEMGSLDGPILFKIEGQETTFVVRAPPIGIPLWSGWTSIDEDEISRVNALPLWRKLSFLMAGIFVQLLIVFAVLLWAELHYHKRSFSGLVRYAVELPIRTILLFVGLLLASPQFFIPRLRWKSSLSELVVLPKGLFASPRMKWIFLALFVEFILSLLWPDPGSDFARSVAWTLSSLFPVEVGSVESHMFVASVYVFLCSVAVLFCLSLRENSPFRPIRYE